LLALLAACSSTSDGPSAAGSGGGSAGGSGPPTEAGPDAPGGAHDAAGEAGSSGATSDTGIADAASDAVVTLPPSTLAGTGFFKAIGADGGFVLGDDVRSYEPRYKLWSDGADKTRWVYLPPGSQIDNGDQDHWSLPVGAKFWKEFAIGGKRIETRLIERFGPGPDDYLYATYWWKTTDAGTSPADAVLVPADNKINNANGTDHDIPFEEHCHRCHDPLKEHVLGFSAFQLTPPPAPAPAPAGITIKTLSDEGRLKVATPVGYEMPGATAVTRDALGYMHANCGNCHNDTTGVAIPAPVMNLRVLVGQRTAEETGAYTTALNVDVTKPDHTPNPLALRIAGGDLQNSSVSFRIALRGMTDNVADQDQMPPRHRAPRHDRHHVRERLDQNIAPAAGQVARRSGGQSFCTTVPNGVCASGFRGTTQRTSRALASREQGSMPSRSVR
jgi:hypothetical protein